MIELKNLSKKEKIGLGVVFVVFLLIIAERIVIAPITNAFKSVDNKIIASFQQLNRYKESMKEEVVIKKEYLSYKDSFKNKGSDEENLSFMLNQIESIARQTDIILLDVKPQQSKKREFYKEYSVEVSLQAKIEGIIKFIYKLNADPAMLRVEKIKLNAVDKSNNIKCILLISKASLL